MDEAQLEITALEWFKSIGWEYYFGPGIVKGGENPLRESDRDVRLMPHLKAAFLRINMWIPENQRESAWEAVLSQLSPTSPDLIENNRIFHQHLLTGMPVTIQNEKGVREEERVFLIDFKNPKNNQFAVVNQVSIMGAKQVRRPDIIAYINGLPIAVIELKSPSKGSESYAVNLEAYHQLQTYKSELPDLFISNAVLVISDGFMARLGSLSAGMDRFMPWRVVDTEKDRRPMLEFELERLIYGFFDHQRLLDYLQNFILFQEDGVKRYKIIAGYHQYHAVENALAATVMASQPDKDGEVGVVWHTQGSGKSLSMCFYAGKLLKTPEMQNPTIVVVTDRTDLDDQLFKTFASAESLFNNAKPVQAANREMLRRLLAEREAGGIIFTTVQKFSPEEAGGLHGVLNERKNIVVISDEAHRTQYGMNAKLNEQGLYTYGYAKHMGDAMPNASFIGFTGTPIEEGDRDTRQVFGPDISVYDIEAAVEDGATVPIYYEPRLARLNIDDAELAKQTEELEAIMEDAELEEREKEKSNWSKLERIVGAPSRIEMVAADIITHFEQRNKESEEPGKGIIVGMSRAICVALYAEIIKHRPDWHDEDPTKGEIKVIMTGSASDPADFQPHLYSKQQRKDLETRFRNADDPFKLVIVCDMWLTGFDLTGFESGEGEVIRLLIPATNYILGLHEGNERNGKKRYLDFVLAMNKAFSLCSTMQETAPYQKKIAFYNRLASFIRKATSGNAEQRKRDMDAVFEQIIRNAVTAEGIVDLYEYCGIDQARIDILDETFFDTVRESQNKNVTLEMLKQLIDNQVKANFKNNVVQESEFSERLKETMRKYNNRTIESAEALEELIKMAKDLTKASKEGERLGLEFDELAFYQALAENESAVDQMGDDMLIKIAKEITDTLRQSVAVDWQKRESIRARLRNIVRITLRKYGYPPDGQNRAVDLILKNTEKISDHWSSQE